MTTRSAGRRAAWGLVAVIGVAAIGLGGCTSGGGKMGDNDDVGWLSGYQPDKNGDGSLSAGERGGGR